jgi:hypothetical protein
VRGWCSRQPGRLGRGRHAKSVCFGESSSYQNDDLGWRCDDGAGWSKNELDPSRATAFIPNQTSSPHTTELRPTQKYRVALTSLSSLSFTAPSFACCSASDGLCVTKDWAYILFIYFLIISHHYQLLLTRIQRPVFQFVNVVMVEPRLCIYGRQCMYWYW